jgi:hypothetical protein
MAMPHKQNTGQIRNMKTGNKSFANFAKFKPLGIDAKLINFKHRTTKKNKIQEILSTVRSRILLFLFAA